MKIAIAGATGFMGQLMIHQLSKNYDLIALSRSTRSGESKDKTSKIQWRGCDLYSLLQVEQALEGADIAIYLVHSMLPTARLMQSSFEDADLLLADNFARGCNRAGVKRIIYLGGLIPNDSKLSRHLASRLEVEVALASHDVPVTTLRAGLILGAEGSSFQMLYTLVKRLPVMICPKWTASLTQPVFSDDVVNLIEFCVQRADTTSKSYDIGGPDILSYRQLMASVAKAMGVKRLFFSIPYFTPGLSRLWVQLITGASKNLVAPLIQSLKHEMLVKNDSLLKLYGRPLRSLADALHICLKGIKPTLKLTTAERIKSLRAGISVRSIQRLPLPPKKSAAWISEEYFRWLPRFLSPMIRLTYTNEGLWSFCIPFVKRPILLLKPSQDRSTYDRPLFYIVGGLLVRIDDKPGRLEFHEVLSGQSALAAIHDFKPRLPWVVYTMTQALVHLFVMKAFERHLRRYSALNLPS